MKALRGNWKKGYAMQLREICAGERTPGEKRALFSDGWQPGAKCTSQDRQERWSCSLAFNVQHAALDDRRRKGASPCFASEVIVQPIWGPFSIDFCQLHVLCQSQYFCSPLLTLLNQAQIQRKHGKFAFSSESTLFLTFNSMVNRASWELQQENFTASSAWAKLREKWKVTQMINLRHYVISDFCQNRVNA